MKKRHSVFVNV
jgi:membrane-bound ClpP family serine protease